MEHVVLGSLLRQLEFLERDEEQLDKDVAALMYEPRYLTAVQELHKLLGVGADGNGVFERNRRFDPF